MIISAKNWHEGVILEIEPFKVKMRLLSTNNLIYMVLGKCRAIREIAGFREIIELTVA